MVRHLRLFAVALWKRWWASMSCAIFTLLGIYVAATGRSSTWVVRTSFCLAVVLFFVAAFLAWREKHIELEEFIAMPGPELVVQYEYERGKDPDTKPLVIRNHSKIHPAYKVRIDPLLNALGETVFTEKDVLAPDDIVQVQAVVPTPSPIFRHHFIRFFEALPEPKTLENVLKPICLPLILRCQDASGKKEFNTECQISYVPGRASISITFQRRISRLNLPRSK
jgi:hypothetical protein